jgi:two-component system sensor histidine kinase KdpD
VAGRSNRARWIAGLGAGVAGIGVVTAALVPFNDSLSRAAPALLLVLPVLAAAVVGGRGVAVVTGVLATVAFTLAFIPPVGSLYVDDAQEDGIALSVFLIVAVLAGTLVAREAERRRQAEQQRAEIARMHADFQQLAAQREQLAAEAQRAEVLEQVDRQRAALLRSVSHDLRTPLATIRTVASDLRSAPDTDRARRDDLLDLVGDEATRLDRIVANVLSLSRIESGSLSPSLQATDLGELVAHSASRLHRLFEGRTVHLHLPEDLPLVLADYSQIDQVVTNLLENAVRHTPPGTAIDVDVRSSADTVVVTVADDGPGLDPAQRDSLFEAFHSGHRATSGIGLAICSAVVEAHGGTIAAGDSPAGGACFTFSLPAAR